MNRIFKSLVFASLFGCNSNVEMPDLRTQLTPERVDGLNIKLMLVELPKAESAALLGIDTVKENSVTWRSQDDQTLTLEDGVVIATRGLAFDLMGSEKGLVPADVSAGMTDEASAIRSFTFLNGENELITVSYQCFYELRTPQSMTRLNGALDLVVVAESCPKPGVDIENRYFFDSTGMQVTSQQWLGEKLGYAIVEFIN